MLGRFVFCNSVVLVNTLFSHYFCAHEEDTICLFG